VLLSVFVVKNAFLLTTKSTKEHKVWLDGALRLGGEKGVLLCTGLNN
jgi:hypothetical protein